MTHNRKKAMKRDPETTHMIKLVNADIKTVTITVLHMFRKLEKRLC